MKIKGKKATISVTLPPAKVIKARELGLNLSRILENALDKYFKSLEGSEIQTMTNGGYIDARSASHQPRLVGRAGFEPATFCTSSRCPNRARRPALHPYFNSLSNFSAFSPKSFFFNLVSTLRPFIVSTHSLWLT